MKVNKVFIYSLFIASFCFLSTSNIIAQVTIGSGIEPNKGALLDLREHKEDTNNSTASKGVLYPRVSLTSVTNLFPMFQPNGSGDYLLDGVTYGKATTDKNHTGLIVYNVTAIGDFLEGLHIWNGSQWRRLNSSNVVEPAISSLVCNGYTMSPNSYTEGTPFEGILSIPYIGGNGGFYSGTEPTSIGNGLLIERIEGQLAQSGTGSIAYRVFGTPTVSSPITTSLSIDFMGKQCADIKIGAGNIKSAYMRNLTNSVLIDAFDPNFNPSSATVVPFEEIIIPEAGSYAFAIRFYGKINYDQVARIPYHVFLRKASAPGNLVEDAAEVDVITVAGLGENSDYSYTLVMTGYFDEGEQALISILKASMVSWHLATGDASIAPRTSLVYWKL